MKNERTEHAGIDTRPRGPRPVKAHELLRRAEELGHDVSTPPRRTRRKAQADHEALTEADREAMRRLNMSEAEYTRYRRAHRQADRERPERAAGKD